MFYIQIGMFYIEYDVIDIILLRVQYNLYHSINYEKKKKQYIVN